VVIVHPYARKLRNGMPNPKTFHEWPELISLINKDVIQIGTEEENRIPGVISFFKDLSLEVLKHLLSECEFWIAVDSFLPHLAHIVGKPGVVIWSVSDPNIFGYPENLNLIKSREYLRPNQYGIWEESSYNPNAFLSAEEIYNAIIRRK
jgi:ADP-heptose:LPS heptosyltransferase